MREKGFVQILAVVIIIFIFIIGGVYILSRFTNLLIIFPQKQQYTKVIDHPTPIPYREKIYQLIRKTPTEQYTIFSFKDYSRPLLVKWQNLLFTGSTEYSNEISLSVLNIDTGQVSQIMVEEFYNGRRYVDDLQIINNTLYVSTGGYLVGGNTYWMNLPPNGQLHKLAEGSNGHIYYEDNHYWLTHSEGDACGGGGTHSLFDPNSKKVTFVTNFVSGCAEGEGEIAIDKNDRMIMVHTKGVWETADRIGDYKNIYAIPLSNPNNKQMIVNELKMPQDIYVITYSEKYNQLLLEGTNKYMVSLSDNSLNLTIKVPDDFYAENPPFPTPIPAKSVKEFFKDLNLPPEYQVVETYVNDP